MQLRISLSDCAHQYVSPVMDCNYILCKWFSSSCPCFHTSPFFHPVLFLPYPSTGDRYSGGVHFCTVTNKRETKYNHASIKCPTNRCRQSQYRTKLANMLSRCEHNDFLNYYQCYAVIDYIVDNYAIRRLSILKNDTDGDVTSCIYVKSHPWVVQNHDTNSPVQSLGSRIRKESISPFPDYVTPDYLDPVL